jgi:diguanylate cyclase (GGDEF)-like protein
MLRRHARSPAVLAAVTAVYYALGKAAFSLGAGSAALPAVFPASGFGLVALLVFGRSIWPACFFGSLLVYVEATGRIAPSMMIAGGNVAEAMIAALLIDRLAGGGAVFRRASTVFRFLAIAALASTPFSATTGSVARVLTGISPWSDLPLLWVMCWLGHLTGMLVVAPVVALWADGPIVRGRWLRTLESVVMIVAFTAVALAVFGGRLGAGLENYPLEFMCMPFLLWAAVRLGRRETASAILVLAGVAAWGTLEGFGPFARDSASEAMLLVQAYTSVTAITGLVLATAVAEHRDAEDQLRQLATTDPLTGLANYRRLLEVLRAEIARSARTKRPFAVLFLDMNGLKKINDRHGHLVGSRALTRLAEALRGSCRTIDTPARFGGDEFAIVLPETGDEGGSVVLNRIADRLAADSTRPVVSVSGGVAVFPRDGDSPTLLLRAADKLLYDAKSRASARARSAANPDTARTGTLF